MSQAETTAAVNPMKELRIDKLVVSESTFRFGSSWKLWQEGVSRHADFWTRALEGNRTGQGPLGAGWRDVLPWRLGVLAMVRQP
jgi:hypothetical protein